MYLRYDAVRDTEFSCPEGMRITDGPRMAVWPAPWPPGVHFYEVIDLESDKVFLCTSLEAAIKCGKTPESFRWAYRRRRKKYGAGNVIINRQWQIKRIPKWLFIKRTGRETNEIREYFWKW